MDERLEAAREHSSVGHGAQGTKPLTWQQRERTEESVDALASILRCTARSPRRGAGRCVRVRMAGRRGRQEQRASQGPQWGRTVIAIEFFTHEMANDMTIKIMALVPMPLYS